jgi:hypothetical protein
LSRVFSERPVWPFQLLSVGVLSPKLEAVAIVHRAAPSFAPKIGNNIKDHIYLIPLILSISFNFVTEKLFTLS